MKKISIAMITLALAGLASISAYAGAWAKNAQGWWYDNGNGTYPANTWQWIDGNNDGIAESYYFNQSGYCLTNTTTPDGYIVNTDGAWTVNGIIQTKAVGASSTGSNTTANIADGYYRVSFNQSDIKQNGGQYTISVTMYSEKTYPKAYVMGLKVGDTVEGIKVNTISRDSDSVSVNDGFGEPCWFTKVQGSNDLYTLSYEDGGYYEWNTLNQVTLPVASNTVFVDEANYVETGTKRYSIAELASNNTLYLTGFYPDNARITVQNGVVVEIDRNYMA